jgi:hypothetical protein
MSDLETVERDDVGDDDLHDEITRLEDRIEALAEAIARCRKFDLAAKLAIAAGGALLVAMMFGIVWFDPLTLLGAIAAMIGGTVVFGSNAATSQQFAADMHNAEALRAELIGRLELRLVEGR